MAPLKDQRSSPCGDSSSFILFIPALVGRLATGVLTQQQKVGAEASEPLLPASWEYGPTWQAHTYQLFQMLALDKEFVVTCAVTSVFQHVLNSITWVLLTRGKATTLLDITKFMLGGMQGTFLSGVSQFGKTFVMRFGFRCARPPERRPEPTSALTCTRLQPPTTADPRASLGSRLQLGVELDDEPAARHARLRPLPRQCQLSPSRAEG